MENIQEKIYKNRMLILLNVVLMTFMACLDGSIVNVALSDMSKKLSVSTGAITWVVTAYLAVIAATILIFGRLGDMLGKTRIFKWGIIGFTAGSLMCGLADSFMFLVAARIVQGIGAAAFMATNQGIITHVFPANERGRALGISGTFVALGTMVGPPLGGFIVDSFSWKYIFLINLPIGIFTYIFGMKVLPVSAKNSSEKIDVKGAVFFSMSILSLFVSISLGQEIGYGKPAILSGFVIALITFVIFIKVERKIEAPLLELNLFKNTLFTLSIFCGFISFLAISCSNIIQPFYLQDAMKYSSSATGLIMVSSPLLLAIVAPLSGHMSDKIGSESLTFAGLLLTSLGLFLMAMLNLHTSLVVLIIFIAVMAIGNGMFQSPNTSLIMSTVPRNRLGIAGSINALVRNLGMVTGISLSTTLLYNRMSSKLGKRVADYVRGRDDIFIYGMRWVYISAAVICLIGALLTAVRLYGKNARIRDAVEKRRLDEEIIEND